MDVDELLEAAAKEREELDRAAKAASKDSSPRKDERDGHDRDRDRGGRERRHRYGGRDRERDRSRDRYRGRRDDRRSGGGDYYSGSGRARSRSPRRRDDHRDRYRDRSRDRRRRDDERPRNGRRTMTPEAPKDADQDKRTVFVQQISQRAETRHLRAFFEAVGEVIDAQIVKDRVTGRSKGVGYVEFKDIDSVPKALELTGQKLKGVPIIVQLTEAEKNRASRAAAESNSGANSGAPFHRLYVGNIHFSVTEDDLREVFEPFGELEQVTLQMDPDNGGRSKGYGFVQFFDPEKAKEALEQMNGFELAGRPIRVGLGNDKFTPESTANLLRNFNGHAQNFQGSAFSGAGGRGAYAGGSGGVFDRTHGRDDRGVSGASALDDTDVAGININNMNRDRLMNLLARNPVEEPTKTKNGQAAPKPRAPTEYTPAPSRCIKIQNAFDPEHEFKQYGENWIRDLENEVKIECDKKYGRVVHIAVDPNTDGDIYVKFEDVNGGQKAMQGLNGRNFNWRTIRASYVVDKIYDSLYASAAKKS
ncbi:splicing factor, CC1-like protein [Westerdykella ornata]|uniref:Splicing factor, CC1-like protein n=1 Tax=Westerdykella ornata TaxID=318751 RepID=A0A6A6JMX3_WESOR|nr:splicing factor, CC1-like protein [Westerdykella ornata]KAF2277278.1 splicing factor, CC1-like protein [Westerdykella ornata]